MISSTASKMIPLCLIRKKVFGKYTGPGADQIPVIGIGIERVLPLKNAVIEGIDIVGGVNTAAPGACLGRTPGCLFSGDIVCRHNLYTGRGLRRSPVEIDRNLLFGGLTAHSSKGKTVYNST